MTKKSKKTKEKKNFQQMSKGDLSKLLQQSHSEMVKLRLDFSLAKIKDVQALKKKRREIARLKTALREKELFGEEKKNETV